MNAAHVLCAVCALAAAAGAAGAQPAARAIARPRPGHPGNVFLQGEEVEVPLPPGGPWRLVDYDDREVARVPADAPHASLGRLEPGFYRLLGGPSQDWVSLAVLPSLKAPTPTTSPICIDVAMAWFYDPPRMDDVASLCALAGVNRVRDRLAWGHMEPERGQFSAPNKYDDSARAQSGAGLQVLQVNHSSPAWANPDGKRFPLDLRDAFHFYREMARRWRGQVDAFEPWNEADITPFGGHTGAEMASMQKASYLGLKAGNPDVTACLNVFATHVKAQLEDLQENAAWPYFETYNLHHYEAFDNYPTLYADHRAVSAGRPMWVTECAMPVRWTGDEKRQELSDADLREQSERLLKVFAGSLHEGSAATYYFVFPHYVEGQTQFGIVRRDLTPRPAYVALAAAGRLLADARPLGRLAQGDAAVRAYAFRARPDGEARTIVVAWSTTGSPSLRLPVQPLAAYDHLGRPRQASRDVPLAAAPVYLVLPASAGAALTPTAAPAAPRHLGGRPSPIVLQAIGPVESIWLHHSAYRIASDRPTTLPVYVYNFGETEAAGTLRVTAPRGWKVAPLGPVRLEPMGRAELSLTVDPRGAPSRAVERVRLEGQFGAAGRPVLSVRFAPDASALGRKPGTPLADATASAQWDAMVSGGGAVRVTAEAGGFVVEAEPKGADRWVFPRLALRAPNGIPAGAAGLACTVTLLEGEGLFRAIFDEKNGSSYVADLVEQPRSGSAVQTVALFETAVHGTGWSAEDPDHRLDLDQIASLKVGVNTPSPKVRFRVTDLRWVKP